MQRAGDKAPRVKVGTVPSQTSVPEPPVSLSDPGISVTRVAGGSYGSNRCSSSRIFMKDAWETWEP